MSLVEQRQNSRLEIHRSQVRVPVLAICFRIFNTWRKITCSMEISGLRKECIIVLGYGRVDTIMVITPYICPRLDLLYIENRSNVFLYLRQAESCSDQLFLSVCSLHADPLCCRGCEVEGTQKRKRGRPRKEDRYAASCCYFVEVWTNQIVKDHG